MDLGPLIGGTSEQRKWCKFSTLVYLGNPKPYGPSERNFFQIHNDRTVQNAYVSYLSYFKINFIIYNLITIQKHS